MEILFAVALMALLVVPIEIRPPSFLSWAADSGGEPDGVRDGEQWRTAQPSLDAGLEMTMQSGLFTRAVIQGRLEALTEELARLDRDPDVFAKAFHTMVARSAYQALLSDAATLIDEPCLQVGESLEFQLMEPSAALWEELDL
jgi:hypothetical protein